MTRKLTNLIVTLLIVSVSFAQQDSVLSNAYEWKQPLVQKNKISTAVMLQGKVHDFQWMQLTANTIFGKKKIKQEVTVALERVIIVKEGSCIINLNDSTYTLTPGSMAILMPGQKYWLKNNSKGASSFYSMNYISKKPMDIARGGKSFVKIWGNIEYKPNNNGGGRRDFFERPTAMQKRFEMHVTTLRAGIKSHEPHTHRAEEIVLIMDGETEMQLGDKVVKTTVGGFYYLGSNVSHAIKNIGTKPSTYFAYQFE
jgi:(S)-ureidoglycine aminohydrolase